MTLSKPSSPTCNGSRPMTYCLESMKPNNDVAVIGMACRTAGGNNPENLWQSLLDQKDASSEIPPIRWEPYHRRDPRNSKVLNQTSSRLLRRQHAGLRRSVLWYLAKGGRADGSPATNVPGGHLGSP